MTSPKRDGKPPPRPPFPKVVNLHGRQKTLRSMAINFKSLDDDHSDDYLDIFSPGKLSNKCTESEPDIFSEFSDEFHAERSDISNSPVKNSESLDTFEKLSNYTPVKQEKRSILSGIKGKLSDKFPDTYNAIVKKIEEFSSDHNLPLLSPDKNTTLKSELVVESPNIVDKTYIDEINLSGELNNDPCIKSTNGEKFLKDQMDDILNYSYNRSLDEEVLFSSEVILDPLRADAEIVGANQNANTSTLQPRKILSVVSEGSHDSSPEGSHDVSHGRLSMDAKSPPHSFFTKSHQIDQTENFHDSMILHTRKESIEGEVRISTSDPPVMYPSTSLKVASVEGNDRDDFKLKSTEEDGTASSSLVPAQIAVLKQNLYRIWILKISVVLFIYFITPLPTFLHGAIMGATAIAAILYMTQRLNFVKKISYPMEDGSPEGSLLQAPLNLPDLCDMKEPHDEEIYKGWMNETETYDELSYHISQTNSVFVRLEGPMLRLSSPETNIAKRAMWDEVIPTAKFLHQRHYDLTGSQVYLQPPGLIKKRVWSKKYPIAIQMTASSVKLSAAPTTSEPDKEAVNSADVIVYLFARAGHEKEQWFYRLSAASKGLPLINHRRKVYDTLVQNRGKRNTMSDTNASETTLPVNKQVSFIDRLDFIKERFHARDHMEAYILYITRFLPMKQSGIGCEPKLLWLNALLGRIIWDFISTGIWAEKIKEKVQKKVNKIQIPDFVEELRVTHVNAGTDIPIIRRASKPYINENGFWIEIDLSYSGGFCITVETRLNLKKLGDKSTKYQKDDLEEMEVSSSDSEDDGQTPTKGVKGKAGHVISLLLDKITKTKYFQQASDMKYIKRAIEEVSNTTIALTVEVHGLVGTLCMNIPPPPTDMLWYGFRKDYNLSLICKPKLGQTVVNIGKITEWIEKKLLYEFQRTFVLPNMDGKVIPLLVPGYKETAASNPTESPAPS